MEPTTRLIDRTLSFALLDPRIEAVILTGSLGRNKKIDSYSDIDIELIGYGATELAKTNIGYHNLEIALSAYNWTVKIPKVNFGLSTYMF